MMKNKDIGKIVHETYRTKYKTSCICFDRAWEDLPDEEQEAWTKSAEEILKSSSKIKSENVIDLPAITSSRYYPGKDTWVIELTRYHRDNLLWLLNAIGYPSGNAVEPFNCANTGDWVGELAIMLSKPGKGQSLDETDCPNSSIEELKSNIEFWLKNRNH